jgi:small basic protein (TIGR04137 family)
MQPITGDEEYDLRFAKLAVAIGFSHGKVGVPNRGNLMSQHRSLKGASTIQAKRNVLKRFERVELLKKRGQFKQGDRVIGLPKTKPDA